jgi:osmotically-inducible protein OsmY
MLALAALISLAGPASLAGRDKQDDPASSPIERQTDEARIELKVRLALMQKLRADGMRIAIEVRGDEVTLAGRVEERSSQELAKEVALSVTGVRRVRNDIELARQQPNGARVATAVGKVESELTDGLLETKVKLALLDDLGSNAFAVEVEATDGVVSLRGTVPSRSYRSLAVATARETSGVRHVIDLLKLE